MTATIRGDAACTIDSAGRVLWGQNINDPWQTASTVKVFTALVAREWINVDDYVTPHPADLAKSKFIPGDTTTWTGVIQASLKISDNGAARAVANQAHPGGAAALLAAMDAKAVALGWTGHVFADGVGGGTPAASNNRMSAWQLCSLMRHVHAADPWLYAAASKGSYLIPVWGGERVGHIAITHGFNAYNTVPIPEFEAGKTGTGNPDQQHIVWSWKHEGNTYYSSVVDSPARYKDARAMMDDVIRATTRRRIVAVLL